MSQLNLIEMLALTLLALLVLVAPGTAIYMAVMRGTKREGQLLLTEAVLPGVGFSVAFWPLLLLYTSLLGLRFNSWLIWSILVLSVVAIVVLQATEPDRALPDAQQMAVGAALLALTLFTLVFRLADIGNLTVPLFGDSLHHTMVTTIIANTGQVPTSYQPFVPVDTFTYHFGFHTLAALLVQIAGAAPAHAVLTMGQVLIAMTVPMSYLLARRFFGSALAGLIAALITGFVSVMPGYYFNFGRYTQLAGMVLLPVAMVALVEALRETKWEIRRSALAVFTVAGLCIVHYRILIFYGLFLIALGLGHLVFHRRNLNALGREFVVVSAVVLLGVFIAGPWLWNVASNYLPGAVRRIQSVSSEYLSGYNSDQNLRIYTGLTLAALGLLGVAVAVLESTLSLRARDKQPDDAAGRETDLPAHYYALITAAWSALLLASIWVVPGAIGSFTVAVSLYLPLGALGGYGLAWPAELAITRLHIPYWVPLGATVVAAPLLAIALHTWQLADPDHYGYVRQSDIHAFRWIALNTPHEARFLISSEFSYAGRALTASDAGMWIPLLTGRQDSIPALAAWSEHPIDPDFFTRTKQLAAYTQPTTDPDVQDLAARGTIPAPLSPSDPALLALMKQMGITHVFSGTAGGASKLRLDIRGMRADPCHYKLVYPPTEGVYVFEMHYDSCPS